MEVSLMEQRLSTDEYIEFLKCTNLGSQYPQERFIERVGKLVNHATISLVAKDEAEKIVGVLLGLTDFAYYLYVTDLGVDRNYENKGIGKRLMKEAHDIAGGENDIEIYLVANEDAIPFYEKIGMKKADDVMQYSNIEWTPFIVE